MRVARPYSRSSTWRRLTAAIIVVLFGLSATAIVQFLEPRYLAVCTAIEARQTCVTAASADSSDSGQTSLAVVALGGDDRNEIALSNMNTSGTSYLDVIGYLSNHPESDVPGDFQSAEAGDKRTIPVMSGNTAVVALSSVPSGSASVLIAITAGDSTHSPSSSVTIHLATGRTRVTEISRESLMGLRDPDSGLRVPDDVLNQIARDLNVVPGTRRDQTAENTARADDPHVSSAPPGPSDGDGSDTPTPSMPPSERSPSAPTPAPANPDDSTDEEMAPVPSTAPNPSPPAAPGPAPSNDPAPSPSADPTTPTPPTDPTPSPSADPTTPTPPTDPTPTPGVDPPASGNVGVPPSVNLRVVDGDVRVTTAGTVIDGQDIRGRVTVEAPNVTIKNSIIRGPAGGFTGPGFLVTSWNQPNLQIIDTEIAATTASAYINGIVGNNYTLDRVNIHNVIDSANILGDNVTIKNSWLHDNLYYEHDPYWNGNPSHADSIQIQNGTNIKVTNNTIRGGRNAGVMITQDRGPVSNFSFTNNNADGGACTINIAEKSHGPLRGVNISDNTFGRNTTLTNCAIIAADTTKALMTIANNYYTPDNTPVTVRRGG